MDLLQITDGEVISNEIANGKLLNIRADVRTPNVRSIGFSLSGPLNRVTTENRAPYALFGDVNGDYAGVTLLEGNYTLTGALYSGDNQTGTLIKTISTTFSVGDIANANLDEIGLIAETEIGVKLFPNPATDHLTIAFDEPGNQLFGAALYDLKGTVVKEYNIDDIRTSESTYSANFFGLSNGIYVLRLFTSVSVHYNYRVVVSN